MFDFEKEFDEFVTGSNNIDPISSIYNLFPNLTDEQLKIYLQLNYLADKYNTNNIKLFLERFMSYKKSNKNMGFFTQMSFRKTLEAYSLAEQMRGVKINTTNLQEQNNGR